MLIINEHKVSQVICLKCYRRWIAARPVSTELTDLECPDCGQYGFAIETGETTIAEELMKQAINKTTKEGMTTSEWLNDGVDKKTKQLVDSWIRQDEIKEHYNQT